VDQQHFELPEVNEAFRQVAEGRGKGKTVIQLVSE
jgi:D-arabinose 1-dehydrogenase-like Zn-dependent alcohol dehydrogenase